MEEPENKNIIKFNKNITKVLADYKIWMYRNKYSINTNKTYLHQIKLLLTGCGFNRPILTSKRIYEFLTGRGIVSRSAIKSFIEFTNRELDKTLVMYSYPKLPKLEKKIITSLSEDEINKIINKLPKVIIGKDFNYRFYTRFLFICALRISEGFRPIISDINFDKFKENQKEYGILIIKKTKGKRERQIPLSPGFMKEILDFIYSKNNDTIIKKKLIFDFTSKIYIKRAIRKLKKIPFSKLNIREKYQDDFIREQLWSKIIHNQSVQFQSAFRKASYEALGKYYSPHILRRSRATQMIDAGVPILLVRDMLGHKSIATTEAYLKTGIEKLSYSMKELEL